MSEALKVNTTLTTLDLDGVKQYSHQLTTMPKMAQQQQRHKTENKIGDEGARALSETLKVNTTLTTLDLGRVQQQ